MSALPDYRDRYPRGAVEQAITALELSFSYLRDQGRPIVEREIEDALRRLRVAKAINEPAVPSQDSEQ